MSRAFRLIHWDGIGTNWRVWRYTAETINDVHRKVLNRSSMCRGWGVDSQISIWLALLPITLHVRAAMTLSMWWLVVVWRFGSSTHLSWAAVSNMFHFSHKGLLDTFYFGSVCTWFPTLTVAPQSLVPPLYSIFRDCRSAEAGGASRSQSLLLLIITLTASWRGILRNLIGMTCVKPWRESYLDNR